MLKDLLLERLQPDARLETELIIELLVETPVRSQRVRLAAGAVQRRDQDFPESLP